MFLFDIKYWTANLIDKPDIKEKSGAKDLPLFHESIEFENVTFAYEKDEPVLHGINLKLRRGEVLAVTNSLLPFPAWHSALVSSKGLRFFWETIGMFCPTKVKLSWTSWMALLVIIPGEQNSSSIIVY